MFLSVLFLTDVRAASVEAAKHLYCMFGPSTIFRLARSNLDKQELAPGHVDPAGSVNVAIGRPLNFTLSSPNPKSAGVVALLGML